MIKITFNMFFYHVLTEEEGQLGPATIYKKKNIFTTEVLAISAQGRSERK